MRVLLVGDSWLGSDARGLKAAVAQVEGVISEDIATDPPFRNPQWIGPRLAGRLLLPMWAAAVRRRVLASCARFRPDVILVVKGSLFEADFIRELSARFAPAVNYFPDASPHGQGARIRRTLGAYDLVISAKAQHPGRWRDPFGYANRCVHVPHGYDTQLHERPDPPAPDEARFDVVMVAGGRTEYADLIAGAIDRLADQGVTFGIGGGGWQHRGFDGRPGVTMLGPLPGAAYVEGLRMGRIVVAPVQTVLHFDGREQPGDEVSARTYQCGAAHVFFLHRRTAEARSLYDEDTEVPMFEDSAELADKIAYYLQRPEARAALASAAHRRAVPAYSQDQRAREIVAYLREAVAARRALGSRSAA